MATLDVEIAASSAVSGAIHMRPYTAGVLRMPTVWTPASLGFLLNEEDSRQTVIQTTITGEATAFTQPVAATALNILQAVDVVADRGRGIVIEGSNAAGVAISETIALNAANTTTVVTGITVFTRISAVYTANGAALGAQNVTIRRSDNIGVCILVGLTSELGADVPAQATTPTGGADQMVLSGPNLDATFVTIVGARSGVAVRERVQFNGASPSAAHSNGRLDAVTRICLGEFTNAATGSVRSRDPWVQLRDAGGALVSLTVAANQVAALPVGLFGARYVRLWSQTNGAAVVQAATRHIVLALK